MMLMPLLIISFFAITSYIIDMRLLLFWYWLLIRYCHCRHYAIIDCFHSTLPLLTFRWCLIIAIAFAFAIIFISHATPHIILLIITIAFDYIAIIIIIDISYDYCRLPFLIFATFLLWWHYYYYADIISLRHFFIRYYFIIDYYWLEPDWQQPLQIIISTFHHFTTSFFLSRIIDDIIDYFHAITPRCLFSIDIFFFQRWLLITLSLTLLMPLLLWLRFHYIIAFAIDTPH
jgi:hypothetical protein